MQKKIFSTRHLWKQQTSGQQWQTNAFVEEADNAKNLSYEAAKELIGLWIRTP